jgi:hypothetical protein
MVQAIMFACALATLVVAAIGLGTTNSGSEGSNEMTDTLAWAIADGSIATFWVTLSV